MNPRLTTIAAVLALGLMLPAPLSAQPDDAQADAEADADASFGELVSQAKTAFEQEDYEQAIELLLAAHRLKDNPRLLLNVARSYDKLDRCVAAQIYRRAYVDHPDAEADLAKKVKRTLASADCQAWSPAFAGRLIVLSEPAGATVIVDGEARGTTPTEVVELKAGGHRITLEKAGYETVERSIELTAGEDLEQSVTLARPKATAPVAATADPADDATADDYLRPRKAEPPINYVAAGIAGAGVVMLGVGMYYDLAAIPDTDAEREAFQPGSPEFQELTDERESEATIALTSYIAGGVLTAAGVGWFVYDYLEMGGTEAGERVGVQAGPDGAQATFRMRF